MAVCLSALVFVSKILDLFSLRLGAVLLKTCWNNTWLQNCLLGPNSSMPCSAAGICSRATPPVFGLAGSSPSSLSHGLKLWDHGTANHVHSLLLSRSFYFWGPQGQALHCLCHKAWWPLRVSTQGLVFLPNSVYTCHLRSGASIHTGPAST